MTFKHIVDDILNYTRDFNRTPNSLSLKQYKKWRTHYTWHAIVGQRYGQSFCNYFGIQDHRIYYERNWQVCDKIIRREWLATS